MQSYYQPVPCMQCENAPCELVCPVAATVHSDEGLNDMVYNRCVGTRYCSNNCPYKVRRFNFLLYPGLEHAESCKLGAQPGRHRAQPRRDGEVHLLRAAHQPGAQIDAEKRGPPRSATARVVTACQQACPTDAIVFGDLNDPNSRVAKLKAEERNYALLAELNTRPRTTYLAAVRNPNPELERVAWRRAHQPRRNRSDGAERPRSAHRRPVIAPGHTFAIGHRQDQPRSS